MIRKIMTWVVFLLVIWGLFIAVQGKLPVEIGVSLGILVCVVVFLWIPVKVLYKWAFYKKLDKALFKYAWSKRFLKAVVGQKEIDEMDAIFREDR